MSKRLKIVLGILLGVALLALSTLYLMNANVQVLNPKGWVAEQERDLIYLSTVLMLLVVVPTIVLTFHIAWKYRASNRAANYDPEWDQDVVAEAVWWGLPCIIVAVMSVFLWKGTHRLDPFRPLGMGGPPMRIQVVALQWKWLFLYPEEGIATVNYVQFPVDRAVQFEITSDAPMNSFWIPQLGGQIYAMPGMRSQLSLIANEAGVYRGASANLSGKGFAGMTFSARASSASEYADWVQSVRNQGAKLDDEAYGRLLAPSQYDPVQLFWLAQDDLFESILMKYNMPM